MTNVAIQELNANSELVDLIWSHICRVGQIFAQVVRSATLGNDAFTSRDASETMATIGTMYNVSHSSPEFDLRAWEPVAGCDEADGDRAFGTIKEPVQSEPKVPRFPSRSQEGTPCVEAVSDFRSEEAGCGWMKRMKLVSTATDTLQARPCSMPARAGYVPGVTWWKIPAGLAREELGC